MNPLVPSRPAIARLLLFVPVALGGCQAEVAVGSDGVRVRVNQDKAPPSADAKVTALMKALGACDRPTFRAMAYGDLYEQFETSGRLDDVCMVVGWLGPLREAKLLASERDDPADAVGFRYEYALSFERGALTLKLYVVDDAIAGVSLSGDDYQRAGQAAKTERYAEFGVHEVSFFTAEGTPNPTGNRFAVGPVVVEFVIGGIVADPEGTYRFEMQSKLIKDGSTVVWKDDEPLTDRFMAEPDDLFGLVNYRRLYSIPEPGEFRLEVVFRDVVADRGLTHSADLVVVESAASPE